MIKTYTEEQLAFKLLEQKIELKHSSIEMEFAGIHRTFEQIRKTLDRLESNQRWLLGLMGIGFSTLLGLMAHGFHWIV